MSQLIDFENLKGTNTKRITVPGIMDSEQSIRSGLPLIFDDEIKLTLQILIHNNPNKINFTPKEAADRLGVGEEFVRRRIKNNKIKSVYFGDKPMIHIAELARIITEGI